MTIKKVLSVTGIILVTVASLAACSSKSHTTKTGKKEVNFATVGTTAPFSYVKDGKLTGFDIEVAKAVFKGSDNYKVTFKKTEWSSVFTGIDSGKFQMGGNNISYSSERSQKYLFSYPIGSTPSVLAVPKNSNIKAYNDISGHKTQVVQGTTTAKQLENFNKEHQKNPVTLKYTNENITQILTN